MKLKIRKKAGGSIVIRQLIISLLYLTPLGYLLSLFKLINGDLTPGVYIYFPKKQPPEVFVKKNPDFGDRSHWIINGLALFIQAFMVVYNNVGGDWGKAYAYMAMVFGVVNVIASLFPNKNWNKNSSQITLWGLIILSLIFTVSFNDIRTALFQK